MCKILAPNLIYFCYFKFFFHAIVNNPKVLIADEPTGNLDPEKSWEIMNLLERINLQGTTILMATHNSQIVNTLRHRVIAIEDGRVVRDEHEGEYGYDD